MADAKFMRGNPRFKELADEEIEAVGKGCEERMFKRGENVVSEGQEGERSAFLIKTGSLKVVKMHEGAEILLGFLNAGEFFGEMALLSPGARSVSVVSVNDATLLELKADTFNAWKKDNSALAFKLMHVFIKALIYRLRVTDRRLFAAEEELAS